MLLWLVVVKRILMASGGHFPDWSEVCTARQLDANATYTPEEKAVQTLNYLREKL